MGTTKITEKEVDWAFEKWNLGYTYAEIAKALYVSKEQLQKRVYAKYGTFNKREKPELIYDFGKEVIL